MYQHDAHTEQLSGVNTCSYSWLYTASTVELQIGSASGVISYPILVFCTIKPSCAVTESLLFQTHLLSALPTCTCALLDACIRELEMLAEDLL